MDPYGVWMTARLGGATLKTNLLLGRYGGPRQLYEADPEEAAAVAGLSPVEKRALQNHSLDDVFELVAQCDRLGIHILHTWEPDYPPLLTEIAVPPFTLFYRGSLEPLRQRLCIAIVGTRSCTRYGTQVSEQLAAELASCGVTVVSGMADGIDASANLGALKGGGRTVAVLGNGVDKAYPAHNTYLMEQILESGGLVLSEYAPGSRIHRTHFPARNRIISGLSQGVLVVEAPLRSGAMITASLALEQNRDLFVVPGNITSIPSEGTNQMLKEQCAKPVTCALDILEEYLVSHADCLRLTTPLPEAPTGRRACGTAPAEAPEARRRGWPPQSRERAAQTLSSEEQCLFEALQDSPLTADQLIALTGLSASKVISALTMLEAKGCIDALPGGRFAPALGGILNSLGGSSGE
mgnify:CR=1 FL=1